METLPEHTESEYERERGKPLPSLNHGHIQFLLSGAFHAYRNDFTIASELTIELENLRVTPDLCVYPKMDINLQEDVVRMEEPPLLAVEIVSPSQSTQDVVDKINDMLDAGVRSCWLVQPAMETITIYTEGEKPHTFSTGTATDPVTDIAVDISQIFDEG